MTSQSWRAPAVEGRTEPAAGAERESLEGWLDYHRDTLLTKCAGLSADQLRLRSAPPSTLSLLGLVRHMTEVERAWFRIRGAREEHTPLYYSDDNPDGDFDDVDGADAEADFAAFTAEIEECKKVAEGMELDALLARREGARDPRDLDVRWAYLHMIEEYARHNGHADILRERIDGVTGD